MGYNSVVDVICLSSFVQLLLSGEIQTKFDLTAVQGYPRP